MIQDHQLQGSMSQSKVTLEPQFRGQTTILTDNRKTAFTMGLPLQANTTSMSLSQSGTIEVTGGPSEELKLSLMKKGLYSILDDTKNSTK